MSLPPEWSAPQPAADQSTAQQPPAPRPPGFASPDAGYAPPQPDPIADPTSQPAYGPTYYPPTPPLGYTPGTVSMPPAGPPTLPPGMPPSSGYAGYGATAAGPGYIAYAPTKTNGLAVASMVVSIVGVLLAPCYGVGAIPGITGAILGHVSRRQIRQRQEQGDGMALAGVIVGWVATAIALAVVAFVIYIIYIAIDSIPPQPSDNFGEDPFDDDVFDAFVTALS